MISTCKYYSKSVTEVLGSVFVPMLLHASSSKFRELGVFRRQMNDMFTFIM